MNLARGAVAWVAVARGAVARGAVGRGAVARVQRQVVSRENQGSGHKFFCAAITALLNTLV